MIVLISPGAGGESLKQTPVQTAAPLRVKIREIDRAGVRGRAKKPQNTSRDMIEQIAEYSFMLKIRFE